MATYYVATTGNDTTGDGSVGNPFASPGKAAAVATSNEDKIFVKAGNYALTTNTPGSGGPVVLANAAIILEGYKTTPGDLAEMPVISWGDRDAPETTTYLVTHTTVTGTLVRNISVNGNARANVNGINSGYRNRTLDCAASLCATGFVGTDPHSIMRCVANSCTFGYSGDSTFCVAKSCERGFSGSARFCIAVDCTTDGFTLTSMNSALFCVADRCGRYGFSVIQPCTLVGCIASNCLAVDGAGIAAGHSRGVVLLNCAGYNNIVDITPTGETTRIQANIGFIPSASFSASPYENQAADDFRPNNLAGGGALLRAAGIGVYGQIDSRDIGAVQHGGTTRPRIYVGGRLRT